MAGRFTTTRAALLPVLGAVAGVIEKRNTIPVLSNLLIEVEPDGARLTGTNLDIEVSAKVAGTGEAAAITLPGGTLHDVVRKLPEQAEIDISFDDKQATVKSGRSRFSMPVLPADDFPRMSGGDYGHAFTLTVKDLSAALAAVTFAISTEETRYYLNGIYWHAEGEGDALGLSLVATDGHRLAKTRLALPQGADGMPGIILPRATCALLDKRLKEIKAKDEAVSIELSSSRICFELGELTIISKLIDGTFPDYQRVIPSGNSNRFRFNKLTLEEALDRVSTVLVRGNAVKFGWHSDIDKHLVLDGANMDLGSANEAIEIDPLEGEAVEIGFNARYCQDMLAAADGDMMIAELGEPGGPAIFHTEGQDTPLFVLMPMRV